jgi:hypothetical protein
VRLSVSVARRTAEACRGSGDGVKHAENAVGVERRVGVEKVGEKVDQTGCVARPEKGT